MIRVLIADDHAVTRHGIGAILEKEATSRLGIKHKTVLAVRLRLMRKLDVHSVAGLTRCAIRRGITPLEAQLPRGL